MKFPVLRTLLSVTAGLVLMAPMAFAEPRVVDCDKGQSLQKAIDAGAGSAKVIEITVVGTCYEDIRIGRRGIRIYGDGLTTIHGRIRVFNSNSIEMHDLTITGPMEGLRLVNSRVRLFDVDIVDNESSGIAASHSSVISARNVNVRGNREGIRLNRSHAGIVDTSVESNVAAGEYSDGILVLQNSSLQADGSYISGNGNLGVRVNWNSTITLRGTHVESNGAYGIQMYNSSGGDLTHSYISYNAGFGIELGGNSALEIYGGDVRGNAWDGVTVSEHAMLRLHDAVIRDNGSHGILVSRDGGVVTHGETAVVGNGEYFQIMCIDDESSIEVSGESVVAPYACSGF